MTKPDKRAAKFGRNSWGHMDYYRGPFGSPRWRAGFRVRVRRSTRALARLQRSFANIRAAAPAVNAVLGRLVSTIKGDA
jgi:hypothetical protein